MQFDVFNGDADGICALIQIRLDKPADKPCLITGVKRDISLVKHVDIEQASSVLVLDISLDKNREAVDQLINASVPVTYFDHHFPGETLPESSLFNGFIDTQPTTCTSLIVNHQLGGQFENWAITAAFGDNLLSVAETMAKASGLSVNDTEHLKLLGTCINYNGYGSNENDLHFTPEALFHAFRIYPDPLDIIRDENPVWLSLLDGYHKDLELAQSVTLENFDPHCLLVMLPNDAWARRVSGVLGNQLANENPDTAIAVLTELEGSDYLVSLRAPIHRRDGADEVARKFETGGGRKAAAGINCLNQHSVEMLKKAMIDRWSV